MSPAPQPVPSLPVAPPGDVLTLTTAEDVGPVSLTVGIGGTGTWSSPPAQQGEGLWHGEHIYQGLQLYLVHQASRRAPALGVPPSSLSLPSTLPGVDVGSQLQ